MRKWSFLLCVAMTLSAPATVAAAPADDAVVMGYSPNGAEAYRIAVSSDGSASIAATGSKAQPFTIPENIVEHFFAALVASRNYPWTSEPCAKRAPYDATIRVQWYGWISGDVTCPPHAAYAAMQAFQTLNNAVMHIAVLAGPPAGVRFSSLPSG
jgi:hypothetical protein